MKLLIAALLALPLFAQQQPVDLAIRFNATALGAPSAARVALGTSIEYRVDYNAPVDGTITIDVPGNVVDVFADGLADCEGEKPVVCQFEADPEFGGTIYVETEQDQTGSFVATARITSSRPEIDPNDNVRTIATEVVALPSLFTSFLRLPQPLSPKQEGTIDIEVRNYSDIPAKNVHITATLPEGGTVRGGVVRSGEAACLVVANTLDCTALEITRDEPVLIELQFTAPDRADGTLLRLFAKAEHDQPDVEPLDNERTVYVRMNREMQVKNTNDSGPGSLRQAILDANVFCLRRTPCSITFRIPPPAGPNGRFVIQPLTPLPVLTGEVKVEGASQTRETGDTNVFGPEVEINGALMQTASAGLRATPNCVVEIYDLAVTGFLGHGIDVSRMPGDPSPESCKVFGSTINAIISRNHLTNNMRGLGLRVYRATVEQNILSNNLRSGLFMNDGFYAMIRNNRIESNGASGIFLDMGDDVAGAPGGADIVGNVISKNAHWGVARTPRGDIDITQNSIADNVYQGIDIGLDFDTPAGRPVLFWAIYDPSTQTTAVRGRLDTVVPPRGRVFLEVYASSRLSVAQQSQAERSVLIVELPSGNTEFQVAVPEDLRGMWVTATSTPRYITGLTHQSQIPGNTSELSNPVFVAP